LEIPLEHWGGDSEIATQVEIATQGEVDSAFPLC
jgi:hypothetical protein